MQPLPRVWERAMSRLLLPCVAAVPGTVDPLVVHLVLTGTTSCVACHAALGPDDLMYTDEPTLWHIFCGTEGFAMYDPVERLIKPYYTCRSEHGATH